MKFEIKGIAYGKNKRLGNLLAPKVWKEEIVKQTSHLPKVEYPCEMIIEFLLPQDKFPSDFPYGPDLDNLLKCFLDALERTILKNDSLIAKVIASKKKSNIDDAGVITEIKKIQG